MNSILGFLVCLLFVSVSGEDDDTGRIVDGILVPGPEMFPHQVGFYFKKGNNTFFCGGSLISPSTVLTAGHCTHLVIIVKLFAGTTSSREGGTVMTGNFTTITHPNYNSQTLANDIGLIFTSTKFVLSNFIQTISLNQALLGENEIVYSSGWGATTTGGPMTEKLYYGILKTTTVQICVNKFGINSNNVVCAVSANSSSITNICQGDSGGPLVLSRGKNYLVGVVSFTSGTCHLKVPTGFTRVAPYKSFIKDNGTWVTIP